MGIALSCHCGKKMMARAEFAGRMVRCPQCGAVMQIPIIELNDLSEAALAVTPSGNQPKDGFDFESPLTPREAAADIIPFQDDSVRKPARAAFHVATATADTYHAWEDRSLIQVSTPWLKGDMERFQKGVKPPGEGLGRAGVIALCVLAAALIGGTVFAFAR